MHIKTSQQIVAMETRQDNTWC